MGHCGPLDLGLNEWQKLKPDPTINNKETNFSLKSKGKVMERRRDQLRLKKLQLFFVAFLSKFLPKSFFLFDNLKRVHIKLCIITTTSSSNTYNGVKIPNMVLRAELTASFFFSPPSPVRPFKIPIMG